ncbi:MAG: biopolymer transporter ExbD [Pseudomonadota bacterium]
MSQRRQLQSKEEDATLDLTPMLDVVFIMLIFFIVTATFIKEAGVDVLRPEAKTADMKRRASILIAVTKSGEIWIDKKKVTPTTIRSHIERLHAENPQGTVVIQADRGSKYEVLRKVMDAARDAKVPNVAVSSLK